MNKEMVEYLLAQLTGGYPAISLRQYNPFYEKKVIDDVLSSMALVNIRLMLGDELSPLEQFGWYVLDDHAKGYTGKSLKELMDEFNSREKKCQK